jgi:hypothetical protein
MKLPTILLLVIMLGLFSCTSVPEEVKENKEKFIQVGRENSQPIEMSDLKNLLEQAKSNKTENKMSYLGVDHINTAYQADSRNATSLDSIVEFKKGNYMVLYDFASDVRTDEEIKKGSGLQEFEKITDRLYLGKLNK